MTKLVPGKYHQIGVRRAGAVYYLAEDRGRRTVLGGRYDVAAQAGYGLQKRTLPGERPAYDADVDGLPADACRDRFDLERQLSYRGKQFQGLTGSLAACRA